MESKETLDGGNSLAHTKRPPILVRLGSKKRAVWSEGGGVQQRGVQRGERV